MICTRTIKIITFAFLFHKQQTKHDDIFVYIFFFAHFTISVCTLHQTEPNPVYISISIALQYDDEVER